MSKSETNSSSKPKIRSSKLETNRDQIRNKSAKLKTKGSKHRTLLALANDRAEYVRQFLSFLNQSLLFPLSRAVVSGVNQPQKEAAFFGFFATDLDPHQKIFLARCLIGFDVIGPDRAWSADELLRIFNVRQGFVQEFNARTHAAGKPVGPLLQIV